MVTYLIKSDILNLHKIGKSENLKLRIKSLASLVKDKNLQVVITFDTDIEKFLHDTFKDKHIKGEWFNLNNDDLNFIQNYKPKVSSKYRKFPFRLKEPIRKKINTDLIIRTKLGLDCGVSEKTLRNWSDKDSEQFYKLLSEAFQNMIKKQFPRYKNILQNTKPRKKIL